MNEILQGDRDERLEIKSPSAFRAVGHSQVNKYKNPVQCSKLPVFCFLRMTETFSIVLARK